LSEYAALPKGMNKVPEEYADYDVSAIKPTTHEDIEYSKLIREAFRNLEKKGLIVHVQKFEMIEQAEGPSIISILAEVHAK
jgi:ribosomal protein S19E (S16A)